jgi:hypothetical protein
MIRFATLVLTMGITLPALAADYIAVADQTVGNPRILVMDYSQKDWSVTNPAAVVWSWKPSDSGMGPGGWDLPNDARLRNNSMCGGQCMITASGYGLIAVISYPSKEKKWSVNIGKQSNVHGIELLPDGNVAVAASTGGWVRVYAASQGPGSSTFTQYNLPDAHNVLWDPARKVLWALGKNQLVQLNVGGTAASPTLTLLSSTTLPDGSGHDLSPKYGDPNTLLLTTGSKTWTYNKTTQQALIFQDVPGYKSINNQADGQIIETRPHPSCSQNTWCTDVVEFYSPTDSRTRRSAVIYRARIWNPDYQ